MSHSKLFVKNLTKIYADVPVLSDISLTLRDGEFASVIGPNASGKTTLLKILAGVRSPTAGTLQCEGSVAYMPQDHALLPWRTVLGNLYLPSDVAGIPRSDVRTKVTELLQEFGLAQYVDFYPAALSGGTRQKIALLRTTLQDHSLVCAGRLLLLDEPFASLDALTRLEAQTWLESLVQKSRASTLLVTHDIREAIFLSDTVYVLGGRPGHVKGMFTVPLPRPREHVHLLEKEALLLEKRLFSLLSETV